MPRDESSGGKIAVQVVGGHGLVWSIQDVLRLRTQHRLVGSMVGAISGFKNQVAVGGLPLQLSAEEVSLALQSEWVDLYSAELEVPTARAAAEERDGRQRAAGGSAGGGQQPGLGAAGGAGDQGGAAGDVEAEDEYWAAYYGLEGAGGGAGTGGAQGTTPGADEQPGQPPPREPPAWRAALATGALLELPLTAGGYGGGGGEPGGPRPAARRPAAWPPPSGARQRRRLAVFADLHARGYTLTPGARFGGDFLAYPGDPALWHAQFVVRVLAPGEPLAPVAFKGLARGVHAARKHLLLATVMLEGGEGEGGGGGDGGARGRVRYVTVAKEDGFGAS